MNSNVHEHVIVHSRQSTKFGAHKIKLFHCLYCRYDDEGQFLIVLIGNFKEYLPQNKKF